MSRLVALLLAAPLLLQGCSWGQESGPADVVQQVVDARTAGECDDYDDLFVGDPLPRCGDPQPEVGGGPEVGEADVDGESATVEVVDHYDCSGFGGDDQEYTDVYRLEVDDGEWKVADFEPAETTSDDCLS